MHGAHLKHPSHLMVRQKKDFHMNWGCSITTTTFL